MRWNVTPSHVVFRNPRLLLFDESQGRVEVRDISTGKVCEVIEEKGLRLVKTARDGADLLVRSARGLLELSEVNVLLWAEVRWLMIDRCAATCLMEVSL